MPSALGKPVSFEIESHETPAILKLTVDYSKEGPPQVSGTFEGLDMSKIQSDLNDKAGLSFQSGTASGTFAGQLTSDQIDLNINLKMEGLQAKGQGDGVLGLGESQTTEIMQTLNELSTTIRVIGPTTDPRLVFDTEGLTDQFKAALAKAGKDRAMKELDAALQKQLGDQVPDQLKETVQKGGQGVIESLGGLFNNKKDDQKKD